jgi:hypothetical protein
VRYWWCTYCTIRGSFDLKNLDLDFIYDKVDLVAILLGAHGAWVSLVHVVVLELVDHVVNVHERSDDALNAHIWLNVRMASTDFVKSSVVQTFTFVPVEDSAAK